MRKCDRRGASLQRDVRDPQTDREGYMGVCQVGSDSSTVCCLAGQLAGAVYGLKGIPPAWVAQVQQWDGGGDAATRALALLAASR